MQRPNRTRLSFVLGRLAHPIDFGYLAVWRTLGWPRQPWFEIQMVKAALLKTASPRVFEWGLGASTIWYTRWLSKHRRDFHWFGIDHDERWLGWVAANVEPARVHVESQPFAWNGESNYEPTRAHDLYIQAPFRVGGQFDVILIDGRFRRRCVDVAMQVVAPGGLVLLSDAHREYYHCSLARHGGRLVRVGHTPGEVDAAPLAWVNRVP
jgi:hypothetical protein